MSTTEVFARVVTEDFPEECLVSRLVSGVNTTDPPATTSGRADAASHTSHASHTGRGEGRAAIDGGRVRVLSNVTLGMASGELDKVRTDCEIWGVECALSVIDTGGPVKRSRIMNPSSLTARVHSTPQTRNKPILLRLAVCHNGRDMSIATTATPVAPYHTRVCVCFALVSRTGASDPAGRAVGQSERSVTRAGPRGRPQQPAKTVPSATRDWLTTATMFPSTTRDWLTRATRVPSATRDWLTTATMRRNCGDITE
eukprot:6218923-Pyramimonas_sp.AAC.2